MMVDFANWGPKFQKDQRMEEDDQKVQADLMGFVQRD